MTAFYLRLVLTDAQRLPMYLRHSNGAHDDSGSEPEDGDDMQEESNNGDDGCDHAVRYARLIAPVVRSARADAARRSRGPPRADGAVFAVLRRSPAELAGPRIREYVASDTPPSRLLIISRSIHIA